MKWIKSFTELYFVPFMRPLFKSMGFLSTKALMFAKECKNNHLTWQFIHTFHIAALCELVLPYVRECMAANVEQTPVGFLTFCKEHSDVPQFQCLFEAVCRFSQAIVNFRIGTRRNNAALIHSAKHMTKEMFFGRSHQHYRKVELHDSLQYQLMPDELKDLWDANASAFTSPDQSSGEDFDFLL